jgi:predicted kinase
MSKRVILLRGLPASGKSTWAKEQVERYPGRYKRISKDNLRTMLDNGKWSKANEKFILEVRDTLILLALQEGYHVLVDDTNLHEKHEKAIRELVKGLATVEIKDFTHVPLETCLERDRNRPNYVGEQVIRAMYRDFLQPKLAQPPVHDPLLPNAIICDLDGTLALLNGRNPYDASRCEEDTLNEAISGILGNYHHNGHHILLASGRSEKHREQTERWLLAHEINYHALYMRPSGDSRKDSIVKREIYEQSIQGKYNIEFVLDDRQQVVDVWRSLGLICLQVAEGDF